MLSIRVDLLTGHYVASEFDDRTRAEWPPHPGRLFSALVAVRSEDPVARKEEDRCLRWLEALEAPALKCDGESEIARRSVLTNFVPVNDVTVLGSQNTQYQKVAGAIQALADSDESDMKAHQRAQSSHDKALAKAVSWSEREATKVPKDGATTTLLPADRGRQPRTFPTVIPASSTVHMVWPYAEIGDRDRLALDRLLTRVGRLGHSSSLVCCTMDSEPPEANLIPDSSGRVQLRVPAEGLLEALERAYDQHHGLEPRVLPNRIASYLDNAVAPIPESIYGDDWLILLLPAGQPVPLTKCLSWTRALRAATLSHASSNEGYISGHGQDGSPIETPHPLFVPLPFSGHRYADGLVRGFAVILPRAASEDERQSVRDALTCWAGKNGLEVRTSQGKITNLRFGGTDTMAYSLRPRRWSNPSLVWTSVTPVVLDRYPKHFGSTDSERADRADAHVRDTITKAVSFLALPAPVGVEISTDPLTLGTSRARDFLPYRFGSGRKAFSVHIRVEFDQKVAGPIVLGAGRHLGYGLMMPQGDDNR